MCGYCINENGINGKPNNNGVMKTIVMCNVQPMAAMAKMA
jgi:hypothetical protein